MPRHVDLEALTALVEGRLSGAALEATLRDIAACPHCQRKHDDYAAVLRIAARAYGSGRPLAAGATPAAGSSPSVVDDGISPRLDARLDEVVRTAVAAAAAPKATRRSFRLPAFALAAASILAAAILVVRDDEPAPIDAVSGVVRFEAAREVVRAGETRVFHFEFSPATACRILVVSRDAAGRVARLFPDPNPLIGTYGRTAPFAAGETVRIPSSKTLDFETRDAPGATAYFAVAVPPELAPDESFWSRFDAETAAAVDEAALLAILGRYGAARKLKAN